MEWLFVGSQPNYHKRWIVLDHMIAPPMQNTPRKMCVRNPCSSLAHGAVRYYAVNFKVSVQRVDFIFRKSLVPDPRRDIRYSMSDVG